MNRHRWVILLLIALVVAPQLAWAEGNIVGAAFPITWTASPSPNLQEYRIYVRPEHGAYDRARYFAVPAPTTTADGATLQLTTDGQYYLVITAASHGASGESDDSAEVPFVRQTTLTPDVTPPLIAIRAPVDGTEVPRASTLVITIDASDNVGITRLGITVSGQSLCVLFGPPWRCSWKVPGALNKRYAINALAIDARGNNAQSQVEVIAK